VLNAGSGALTADHHGHLERHYHRCGAGGCQGPVHPAVSGWGPLP